MSMLFGPASSDSAASGLPRGEVLGTYESHADARKIVDRLAEQEFDVRTVSIVGVDLRTVERIRNRLTYSSVALRSALQGAFFGLMLGILMSLIDPSGAGLQILYTVGLGVGIWVLFGVIGHSIRKGKGFDSVQQLVPTRFDVVCEFAGAPKARQILGLGTAGPTPAPPPVAPVAPVAPKGQGSTTEPAPASPASPEPPAPAAVSDAVPGPSPEPAPESAADATPVTAGTPVSASDAVPVRTHHFPDLPDGRPQYGVRLPEAEAQALREQILTDQTGGPSGVTPGSFEAPDYGQGRGRRKDPNRPVDGGGAPGRAAGLEAAEGTADAAAPTSETTDTRFDRPRYGRHTGGPETPSREPGPGAGVDPVAGPAADQDTE